MRRVLLQTSSTLQNGGLPQAPPPSLVQVLEGKDGGNTVFEHVEPFCVVLVFDNAHGAQDRIAIVPGFEVLDELVHAAQRRSRHNVISEMY